MANTGAISPTICESIDRDGKGAWDDPTNALTQDDVYAFEDIAKNTYTDWLRARNFEFDIPIDAIIDGILVEVEWYSEDTNVDDDSIRLVLDGVVQGDDKSMGADVGTVDDDTYAQFGGSTDDWNAGLDYADINNENFGVQISIDNDRTGQSRWVRIDHIRITVFYTDKIALGRGYIDDYRTDHINIIHENPVALDHTPYFNNLISNLTSLGFTDIADFFSQNCTRNAIELDYINWSEYYSDCFDENGNIIDGKESIVSAYEAKWK